MCGKMKKRKNEEKDTMHNGKALREPKVGGNLVRE